MTSTDNSCSRNINDFSSRASSLARMKAQQHKVQHGNIFTRVQRRRNQTLIHGKKTGLFPLTALSIGYDDNGKGKLAEAIKSDMGTTTKDVHNSPRDSVKMTDVSIHGGLVGAKLSTVKHSVDVGTLRAS